MGGARPSRSQPLAFGRWPVGAFRPDSLVRAGGLPGGLAGRCPLRARNPRSPERTESFRLRFLTWAGALALGALAGAGAELPESLEKPAGRWDPVEAYQEQQIEGWTVRVHQQLLARTNLAARTLKLLEVQLWQITRVVPATALERLRQIPIWVELAHPRHPCMCYHESAAWLRAHAMNPDKAGAVEVANAETFLRWTRDQPWMVLHELAHGYHHRVLGHDHAGIRRCFERARAAGSYESVLRSDGRRGRAYALQNAKEYFAELTEAFFGTNDFFPFVRAEVRTHDPEMFAVLEEVWGLRPRSP